MSSLRAALDRLLQALGRNEAPPATETALTEERRPVPDKRSDMDLFFDLDWLAILQDPQDRYR